MNDPIRNELNSQIAHRLADAISDRVSPEFLKKVRDGDELERWEADKMSLAFDGRWQRFCKSLPPS